MTRKEFDKLWVGSIVHLHDWPYRVIGIDRARSEIHLTKMPESQFPDCIISGLSYVHLAFVPMQKPPLGQTFGEEEERI